MDYVDKSVAQQLVQAVNDRVNPLTALEAAVIRDRWLFENDLGALGMSPDAREILEKSRLVKSVQGTLLD